MSQSNVLFGVYSDSCRATGETAPVLAAQIAAAAPRDLSPEEKKRLEDIQREAANVSAVITAREQAGAAVVRPDMIACVGAWTGGFEIASGKARLDPSTSEEGAKAKEIVEAYFAEGVPVTGRDASETFGVSRRLLQRIADEKRGETFEAVIGADMLALIRSTTDALGDALGAGDKPRAPVPSGNALQDALVRFGRKVAAYCRLLMARVDEDDPKSMQRFLDAVAPIDAYRENFRANGGAGKDEPGAPVAPVTNVAPGMPGGSPFVSNA